MKRFFAFGFTAFFLFSPVMAKADIVALSSGDKNLSDASATLIDSVISRNHTTDVSLLFALNGCGDHLGPVFYDVEEKADQTVVLHVSGVNIGNEFSERARCIVAPTTFRKITIAGSYPKDSITVVALQVAPQIKPIRQPPVTCMAFWSGFEFNQTTQTCESRGASGCSNPFPFQTKLACESANGL